MSLQQFCDNTVETRYKEMRYNKISDIKIPSGPNEFSLLCSLLCIVLTIDRTKYLITNKISKSQGPHYKEFSQ